MSTCAILVVRDEADIIEATIRHLLWHADEVIVEDHRSTDGTREILQGLPVELRLNDDPGFWHSRQMTALAAEARDHGHRWVLACDADEIWEVTHNPTLRIADFLGSLPMRTMIVYGRLFDYRPSATDDPAETNPVKRLVYREREPNTKKVAARVDADLVIGAGNHTATYGQPVAATSALTIRHYSFRSEAQFLRKVRNGMASASVAAGMPEGYADGWNQWRGKTDGEITAAFRERFWSAEPANDPALVYDPAP